MKDYYRTLTETCQLLGGKCRIYVLGSDEYISAVYDTAEEMISEESKYAAYKVVGIIPMYDSYLDPGHPWLCTFNELMITKGAE